MKTSDIPFNMKIYYDEKLDEEAQDFDEMEKGVDFLKEKFEEVNNNSIQAAILLGQIGTFLRVLNQLPEAEKTFQRAMDILEKHDDRAISLAIQLRMSLIDLAKKKYISTNKIFEESLNEIQNTDDKKMNSLLDFVLFNYGRSKFAEGANQEALQFVTKALELRLAKGDMEAIEHTQQVLSIINQKINA